jgi:hypothetical protein
LNQVPRCPAAQAGGVYVNAIDLVNAANAVKEPGYRIVSRDAQQPRKSKPTRRAA